MRSYRRNQPLRWRKVLAACVAAVAVVGFAAASAQAQSSGSGSSGSGGGTSPIDNPTGDPSLDWLYHQRDRTSPDAFYDVPANLDALPDGGFIRSRETLALPIFGIRTTQIAYKTTDSHGKAVLAATSVLIPQACQGGSGSASGSSSGSGGGGTCQGRDKLVSYEHAINSTGFQCNPSYIFANGGNIGALTVFTPFLKEVLDRGYIVTVPDHNGPYMSFIAGRQSGQASLDAVRATLAFPSFGLAPDAEVGVVGQSGGAHATAWTTLMHKSYAPELNLVGAAMAGPPLDIKETGLSADGTAFSFVYITAVIGLAREFPQETKANEFFSQHGKDVVSKIGASCMIGNPGTGTGDLYGQTKLASLTNFPDSADAIEEFAPTAAVQEDNQAGKRAPAVPWLVIQGNNDAVVPASSTAEMVRKTCALGATIDYHEVEGGHVDTSINEFPRLVDYLGERFADAPAPTNC